MLPYDGMTRTGSKGVSHCRDLYFSGRPLARDARYWKQGRKTSFALVFEAAFTMGCRFESTLWPQRLKIKRKLTVMLDRQQMNSLAILGIQHQIIAEQIFAQLTIT